MKAIMITYNQVLNAAIVALLDELDLRGFTRWTDVEGRGSDTGEPHLGTHIWPALNQAMLCVVADEAVDPLLEGLQKIDPRDRGLRAFVWPIESAI